MKPSQSAEWIEPLNPRELEILELISEGLSNREIAQSLSLSLETVKWYNKQIFAKLGAGNRTEAAAKAREYGLLGMPEVSASEPGPSLHNLPAELTSFVGRSHEIAEIKQLLKSDRLVVLTGPGGTGKTRLALQVARELQGSYRDGVWNVELAPLADPEFVADAIAQVFQLNLSGEFSTSEILKRYLSRKHLLLLMDNFEHLLEAAPLVGDLLAAAPQLSVLATSRERLNIYGEREYSVYPLSLPDMIQFESVQQLLSFEATDLFVQRARAVQHDFDIKVSQFEAIVQISQRLDGLPLALELAATQVKMYPLEQLASRLNDRMGSLPAGPRDLPARQRTLRAAIEWSYDLLSAPEKHLFARLAVFSGGANLDAVRQVCGQDLSSDLENVLASLVDKNLVVTRSSLDAEMRFTMLETIREFARECLENSDELDTITKYFAAYYTELCEQSAKEMRTFRQTYWFERLRIEQENIRAVLLWSLEGNETIYGLRMAAALRDYWYYSGFAAEARRWLDLALEKSQTAPLALQAEVLFAMGEIAYALGDMQKDRAMIHQALEISRELDNKRLIAWSLVWLGGSYPDDPQQGMQLCSQGIEMMRELGDLPGLAQGLNIMGELSRMQNDYEAASRYYEECLSVVQQTGEQLRVAMIYENLSYVAYHQQQYQQAVQLGLQALKIVRDMGNQYGIGTFIGSLAGPMAMLGGTLAGPITMLGGAELAARVLGASSAILETLGIDHQPSDQPEIDRFYEVTRNKLGEEAFEAAWQAGHAMSMADAVDLVLSFQIPDEDA